MDTSAQGAVAATLAGFEANAQLVEALVRDVPEARLRERRIEGKWSAHENLAHLGQFHSVIRERAHLIAEQDTPRFARYVPEQDPGTQAWMEKGSAEMLADFQRARAELLTDLRALPEAAWSRTGSHAAFGTLTLAQWLTFWLAHDGHHLITAATRART